MNDSFESDERKRKETIECLYWSLMNGWDILKDIREHYGFSEDYELYHQLESMEPEDYRERRLRGEIPDAVEVDVRLTHAVEKVFERLCSPPPVQYLDKLRSSSGFVPLLPYSISTSCTGNWKSWEVSSPTRRILTALSLIPVFS